MKITNNLYSKARSLPLARAQREVHHVLEHFCVDGGGAVIEVVFIELFWFCRPIAL